MDKTGFVSWKKGTFGIDGRCYGKNRVWAGAATFYGKFVSHKFLWTTKKL